MFVATYSTCKACTALQAAQERQAKTDEPARKAGRNPDFPRRWRIDVKSRTEMAQAATRAATAKTPQQRMWDAIAKLDQELPAVDSASGG